jgi:2-polyprenyl-3-methyl-5-hydroxy-6-metoxy-1,4-benzoquinol methylase
VTRQAGYESHEYDRLKERKFRPYSRGHQVMYLQAIAELKRDFAPGSVRVLEAGFGIGWGLGEMLKAGILKSYVGYEPNKDSFNYVKGQFLPGGPVDLYLLNLPYEPNLAPDFDAAFCIEVIEHVPMDQHVDFLRGLHRQSPLLFLSTPDKDKKPTEGVRTKDDWVMRLIEAGFSKVDVMTKEWTYLYRCTR